MDEHGSDAPEWPPTAFTNVTPQPPPMDRQAIMATPLYGPDMEATAPAPQRRYLPTLADLVDRLTIVQMKMIFIPERRAEYATERADILHDVDLLLRELPNGLTAKAVWAITVVQLANRFVWENETKIRDGSSNEPADIQLKRLKATHAINGVRNTAKNVLAECVAGSRVDYKVDCMASDLPAEFGSWDIF